MVWCSRYSSPVEGRDEAAASGSFDPSVPLWRAPDRIALYLASITSVRRRERDALQLLAHLCVEASTTHAILCREGDSVKVCMSTGDVTITFWLSGGKSL
jgi:hypothetical protein